MILNLQTPKILLFWSSLLKKQAIIENENKETKTMLMMVATTKINRNFYESKNCILSLINSAKMICQHKHEHKNIIQET